MATIDDFIKIEMKIGKVLSAEPVEGSSKLLKMNVDFNEKDEGGSPKFRQVVSGIAKDVTLEDIIGKQFPFVTNFPPRTMAGVESQAMMIVVSEESGLTLLNPTKEVVSGAELA